MQPDETTNQEVTEMQNQTFANTTENDDDVQLSNHEQEFVNENVKINENWGQG